MPEDPKTIAIDSSELLERHRSAAIDAVQVPKTVAIDPGELARRQKAAGVPPAPVAATTGPSSRAWMVIAAVLVGLVLAYVLVA